MIETLYMYEKHTETPHLVFLLKRGGKRYDKTYVLKHFLKAKMHCQFCTHRETKVLESRVLDDSIRRRRECLKCTNRFTTYEKAIFKLTVLKKDGREEPFNIQKLTASIQKACGKTDAETIRLIAKRAEQKILKKKNKPIKTTDIGRYVLTELKRFDKIAYLRFTSIYKEIEDPKVFEKELKLIT